MLEYCLRMKFPVDFLAKFSQADLEVSARNYMNSLLYSNRDSGEQLILSDSTKVSLELSRVGFIPLYGSSDKTRILALFSPTDPLTAVALYLLDQWWTVDDILKTSDHARDGAVEVQTIGERLVLYVLNRVIYRVREMNPEELPFLCHGEKDFAKIYWSNGEAVGFYSVKLSGSLYHSFSTRRYQLPVMDSIFVTKYHRGNGFGLNMLEDFVMSFHDDCVGLRYPLTKAIYKMCEKYLCQYPGDTDLLWEVESIGCPNQRFNIAKRIQNMDLKVSSLLFDNTPHEVTRERQKEVAKEPIATQTKEAESMAHRVEIEEEVLVCTATRDTGDKPVPTWSRSSEQKQEKKVDKIAERQTNKVIRVEDIEAETPKEHLSSKERTAFFSDLVVIENIFCTHSKETRKDDVGIAVEESVAVNTTVTTQQLEDAPALADNGSTSNDPAQESMKTQGSVEEHEQTQSKFAIIEAEDNEQEKQVDEFPTMVDQSSMEQRADLDKPEFESVQSRGRTSVFATTQCKSKKTCSWHQSEGEEEGTAAHEKLQVEQTGQTLREVKDKGVREGIRGKDVTQSEEYTETKVEMEKDNSMTYPEIQEKGHIAISEIDKTDKNITVSDEKKIADSAIETRVLRKRRKSAPNSTRSKRARINPQIKK
ncbi:soluble lamin-associated protein of 75 kDa-like isoform X2 [Syngnathus typhle]|uniref:soluble lamin-associated protein of 75 kDa-like isoform X2 n=1 Tax=Syngnathus typhle TaxID=161592 RepID=UPI002A6B5006|nr:soluble lamin-associated protein of 75 kDa-like isoform X2 [Syngnathus typhle]